MNNAQHTHIAHIDTILRDDQRITAYTSDTMREAVPDAVVRPRDAQDVQEITKHCNAHHIGLTTCGSRTAMTGSATSDHGIVMCMEKMSGVLEIGIRDKRPFARALPGTIVSELQAAATHAGFFYPPSPTSRFEATLGGTVATNATGDNTYKYGSTRRYIRELSIIHADGNREAYQRPIDHHVHAQKNTAGYTLEGPRIDHFIGSEGTLGITTEITVDLLPAPAPRCALMVFFPDRSTALQAIVTIDAHNTLAPSAMEYLDATTLRIMSANPDFPGAPHEQCCTVIFYDEVLEDAQQAQFNLWLDTLRTCTPAMDQLLDATIVATDDAALDRIHQWRHYIPAHVNELGRSLAEHGGGKVGSDWWVPLPHMQDMMHWVYDQSDTLGIPFLAFAHLGNGHPHVNYLTRTSNERTIAQQLVYSCCRRAVELGGGVAGEHGIGKLKHELLLIQHDHAIIEKMRALKTHYDPHWILAPGNIFPSVL